MRKYLGLLAGIAATAVASAASANTFNAATYTVVDTSQTVNLSFTGPPAINETVYASEIKLNGQINGVGAFVDFTVWCLDVANGINLPYSYDINVYTAGDIRPGMRTLDATQTRQIASLMAFGLTLDGSLAQAATQLAIWKVEYGDDITFNGLNGTLATALANHLSKSSLGGDIDCANCIITVLTDAPIVPSQAFGFATIAETPIPGAVWLFASGIVGIGALTRRRRKKNVIAEGAMA